MASVGDSFEYSGTVGFGEMVAGHPLTPDMADLDLQPGTAVEVAAVLDEVVIIRWVDRRVNERRTSINPSTFAAHFTR
jgi:hypothetical protein